ncbi:MAG: BirA family transcriptional regulator [Thermoplasmata archaeon]|jgi:BirA family biotin operon repressor/biotin-[acetyl-CoA-carboxylase] ligase|nr:BirA family transcriptional regulator [Thermoplasmata archaeon]
MEWRVERKAECASTQDEARKLARAGAPEGTVVVAERMTGGRGTEGRPWAAPAGGLYLSLVLRPPLEASLLTIALGCAVADTLEIAGAEPKLKWVNDVLVDGRKCAGVLVEAESTGDKVDFWVCGIGVNVNGQAAKLFPPPLNAQAITLEEVLGCDSCVPDLEAALLAAVANRVAQLRRGMGAVVLTDVRARDALLGKRVTVRSGNVEQAGTADGIDDRGRLRLQTAGGPRLADVGTVTIH